MTTSSRATLAAFLVGAGLTFGAAPAHAQPSEPSAADLESARELYREGKELRQKGDLRGALERFKAAHEYGQTPVTGLELGKTHLQLGELIEAREVLLSIARIKVASDETAKSDAARAEARELAEQIRPRIPTLVVKIGGVKSDAALQVTVDGANAPVVGLSTMRKVNPGEHAVVVRAEGRQEKRSIALGEGEVKEVAIDITDASPAVTESDGSNSADRASPAGKHPIHVMTWIGAGVGVAGLAVGGIAGVMALGKAGDVSRACQGLSCPPSARSDVDEGRTAATISTIAFAAGAAGVAAAAVGYFVLSPTKSTPNASAAGLRLAIQPAGVGVHGVF